MTLTTLQLAERIVAAVRETPADGQAAEAVMETLRAHDCWFCRLTGEAWETATLLPVDQPLPFDGV